MQESIDKIESLLNETEERIEEYKANGGEEHNYLDGKVQAYTDVLNILKGE
jgi:hypothetical protein